VTHRLAASMASTCISIHTVCDMQQWFTCIVVSVNALVVSGKGVSTHMLPVSLHLSGTMSGPDDHQVAYAETFMW
jgi:hypothetical protein